ncbi:hypothetical protein BGZ99_007245 [Dissophora globulifera]|uniref:Transcription activator GCR1-like domain-containing protein n=1 Tax=Dissophora globulifera TaxID=979702 RepID=A0A9P6RA08_9FUNG|nr:hypothetical protein BGZ99_007245 [Dissophora globulifera]
MNSLPDEDAGLVFWEDFCDLHSWPKTPTGENIRRYKEVFVNDMEKKLNRRRGLTKGDRGYRSGDDFFIKPVLRLRVQILNARNAAEKSVVDVHVSPSPLNKSSNDKVHADDTAQISSSTGNNNSIERPMFKSETDSEDSARISSSKDSSRSSVSSLVVSAPSESLRSNQGRLTSSPDSMVSPHHRESIPRFLSHDYGEASSVSHSNNPSGSNGSTLNAGGSVVEYPQFKAREFNMGLSRDSSVKDVTYNLKDVRVETVPEVLEEWRYGLEPDRLAIQELNCSVGARWRVRKEVKFLYETRRGIVKEYRRLVIEDNHSDTEAIQILEQRRAGRSIATLHNLINKEAKTEKKKEPSIYGQDEPEYPKDLVNQGGRVPRPLPIEKTGFPIKVRLINTIPNIWKEWTVGWGEGEPSIEKLIRKYNRAWNDPKYEKEYGNHFRYKNQVVRTIEEAMRQKAVQSLEEVIQTLENLRGTMEPSTLCKSQVFKDQLKKWNISTAVPEYWLCNRY